MNDNICFKQIILKQIIELWRRAINRKEITLILITKEWRINYESRAGTLSPDWENIFTPEFLMFTSDKTPLN